MAARWKDFDSIIESSPSLNLSLITLRLSLHHGLSFIILTFIATICVLVY